MIRLSVAHARCLKCFWKYMLRGPWNTSWKKNLKIQWKIAEIDRISVFFRPMRPCFGLFAKDDTLNAFGLLRAFCRSKNFENGMEKDWVTGSVLLKRPFWRPSGGHIKKWRPKRHARDILEPRCENGLLISRLVFAFTSVVIESQFLPYFFRIWAVSSFLKT